MKRLLTLALAVVLPIFVMSCSEEAPTSAVVEDSPAENSGGDLSLAKGMVEHHASMGGADLCEALGLPTGCDANFSLVANQTADGSVLGQWQDTFAGGGEGIHVAVNCLNVVGNGAVVGGIITHGKISGVDVSGQRALTAVVDNGISANDPADQMSFSFFPVGELTCDIFEPSDFPLFDLTHGQVIVW